MTDGASPARTALRACALAGGAAWLASEFSEVFGGGMNTAALALTSAFHALLALGAWGVRDAYAPGSRGATFAAAAISVGFGAMTVLPALVLAGAAADVRTAAETWPAFKALGMAGILGSMLLGVDGLRGRRFPWPWAAILVACPPVMAAVLARGQPMALAWGVNMLQSLAWMALGWGALRRRGRPAAVAG